MAPFPQRNGMDKKMQGNMGSNMPTMSVKDICKQAENNTKEQHGSKSGGK